MKERVLRSPLVFAGDSDEPRNGMAICYGEDVFTLRRLVAPEFSTVLKIQTTRRPRSLANTDGGWTKCNIENRERRPLQFGPAATLEFKDWLGSIEETGRASTSLEDPSDAPELFQGLTIARADEQGRALGYPDEEITEGR